MSSIKIAGGVAGRGDKEVVQRTTLQGADGVRTRVAYDQRLFVLTVATYTDATKTIAQTGAFTNYTFTSGDEVRLLFTSGAVETHQIASKTDNNSIVLSTNANGGADATGVRNLPIEHEKLLEMRAVQDGGSVEVTQWTRVKNPGYGSIPLLFELAAATYDHTGHADGERILNETGAFSGYLWTKGDLIAMVFQTGAMEIHEIAAKVNDNSIRLAEDANGAADASGVTNTILPWVEGELTGPRYLAISSISSHATTPTVTTAVNHGYPSGTTFEVDIQGTSGGAPDADINGSKTATSTGVNTFTVPGDTSTTAPTGGTVTVPEAVPWGGWYNWDFRIVNSSGTVQYSDLTDTKRWGVGFLFLILGQSNTVGFYFLKSTPDAAHAMVSAYMNAVSVASTNIANRWTDLTAVGEGNGLHTFLNQVRTDVNAQYGADIPVGAVCEALGATGLIPLGDWNGAGFWLDEPQGPFEFARTALVDATGAQRVAGISYQQGEAESAATDTANATGEVILPGQYKAALGKLRDRLLDTYRAHAGTAPGLCFGSPCRFFTITTDADSNKGSNAAISAREIVVEDQVSFCYENDYGYIFMSDLEVEDETDNADYGLHIIAASGAIYGTRLAHLMMAVIGVNVGATGQKKAKRGPRISRAKIGSHTDSEDRTKITLYVEHGAGTYTGAVTGHTKATAHQITLAAADIPPGTTTSTWQVDVTGCTGTGSVPIDGRRTATWVNATTISIPIDTSLATGAYANGTVKFFEEVQLGEDSSSQTFDVRDQAGGLAVTAVATAVDPSRIELTVERDTSVAGLPFTAPDRIVGNHAIVRYLGIGSIPDENGTKNLDFMIQENIGAALQPLVPTYGYLNGAHAEMGEPSKFRVPLTALTPLRDAPGHSRVYARTTITTFTPGSTFVLPAPNSWDGTLTDLRPGDRFIVEDPAAPNAGFTICEGIVRNVSAYTDQSSAVTFLATHDLTGQSASAPDALPADGDAIRIIRPYTPCGILAVGGV